MPSLAKDFEHILFNADRTSRLILIDLNDKLAAFSPVELIILSLAASIILRFVFGKLQDWYKIGLKVLIFRVVTNLPFLKGYL
jgi:hypothetical protein